MMTRECTLENLSDTAPVAHTRLPLHMPSSNENQDLSTTDAGEPAATFPAADCGLEEPSLASDDGSAEPAVPDSEAEPPPEALTLCPVRIDKFILLSLLTFGLYNLVWFYRNWRVVKSFEDPSIWPWARTLFSPLFYYGLLTRTTLSLKGHLAVAYFALSATWRLPDPYSLISCFSFLALLPAVSAINRLNPEGRNASPSYRWRTRSIVVALIGALLWPLNLVDSFGPADTVLKASEMRQADVTYLLDSGILDENEDLLLFYSAGFLSMHSEGVLASDWGITSYWTDPVSEELQIAFLAYEDIEEIESNPSRHLLENTWVRIRGYDGSVLLFELSAEKGGDLTFLQEVERRRAEAPRQKIEA